MNLHNLFLIGYRCTGKSTVGRSLAGKLSRSFVDTDALVATQQHMSIREIVDIHGWDRFREMEHLVLKNVCCRGGQVVATGGGIVLNDENVMRMKKSGKIIWLGARPETIKARMLQDKGTRDFRPALTLNGSIYEIEETLKSREPLYKKAMDFFVDTDEHAIREVVEIILEKIRLEYPKALQI
ncbi:MAG: shikimate kinase [Desulfobacteraceae bacterium]|jgi:shikimate kinase|nr:shikimate kinase [Desulfobacteraceae bacterium]